MSRSIALENIKIDRKTLLNLTQLFAAEEGTCLLYSGGTLETAQHSFLCLFPYDFIWIQGDKQVRYRPDGECRTVVTMDNPWDALKALLPKFNKKDPIPEWIGFFGYEMGAFSDPEKKLPYRSALSPDVYLQRCAIVLAVDHHKNSGHLYISDQAEYFLREEQRQWLERLVDPNRWLDLLNHLSGNDFVEGMTTGMSLTESSETLNSFSQRIAKVKERIQSGEIQQVNLSQRLTFTGRVDPFQLFLRLVHLNPVPFAVYLRLRSFTIVSSSPERFLKKKGNTIESRPIKGMAPRGKTPDEDLHNKEKLLSSIKEKTELSMITNSMRDELNKISCAESVETPQILGCDAYLNMFHLYSIIRSQVLPDLHPLELVRTCFPGGSITGYPKLSAMSAIADLENHTRGVYTGALGYFAGNGDFDFNIALRTLMIMENQLIIHIGGAISADSDVQKEFEEIRHKEEVLFQALDVKLPTT
jgi:para-aminobenzoate synthetase component I